jgi:hypothetical protein
VTGAALRRVVTATIVVLLGMCLCPAAGWAGPPTSSHRALRVLMMGDSVMAEAAPYAMADLRSRGMQAYSGAFDGTSLLGVTNVRGTFPRVLAQVHPDVVVAEYLGAYRTNPSTTDVTENVASGSPQWWAEWRIAAQDATRTFLRAHTRVYWVLLPISRYAAQVGAGTPMDSLYESLKPEFPQLHYINAISLLSGPNDQYLNFVIGPDAKPVPLHQLDGLHFMPVGARILGRAIANAVLRDYHLPTLPVLRARKAP